MSTASSMDYNHSEPTLLKYKIKTMQRSDAVRLSLSINSIMWTSPDFTTERKDTDIKDTVSSINGKRNMCYIYYFICINNFGNRIDTTNIDGQKWIHNTMQSLTEKGSASYKGLYFRNNDARRIDHIIENISNFIIVNYWHSWNSLMK